MKRFDLIKFKIRNFLARHIKFRKLNLGKAAGIILMVIGAGVIILLVPLWLWYILLVILLVILSYIIYRVNK